MMEIKKSQPYGEGGAEAILNVQPNTSISIAHHHLFGPHDDLMLLELDEKLLPDILNQRLTLRGQPDEDAVLCCQSKLMPLNLSELLILYSLYLLPTYRSHLELHQTQVERIMTIRHETSTRQYGTCRGCS